MRICLLLSRNGSRRRRKGDAAPGKKVCHDYPRAVLDGGHHECKSKSPEIDSGPDTYYHKWITPIVKNREYCRVTEEGKGVEP
jgi:hypothetical protein